MDYIYFSLWIFAILWLATNFLFSVIKVNSKRQLNTWDTRENHKNTHNHWLLNHYNMKIITGNTKTLSIIKISRFWIFAASSLGDKIDVFFNLMKIGNMQANLAQKSSTSIFKKKIIWTSQVKKNLDNVSYQFLSVISHLILIFYRFCSGK